VGHFDFAGDEMDTCIAIRTTLFKNGTAYLQAGAGIVFDSVEESEYIETIDKLQGNVRALEASERECDNSPPSKLLTQPCSQGTGMQFKTHNCKILSSIPICYD
jgi:anthranilate synthase component I